MQTEAKFVCEIRDIAEHASTDDPSSDADYTIVTDELHPGDHFTSFDELTVHIENTHDQAIDVDVESDHEEGDFTNEVVEGTVSPDSGGAANLTLTGPRGRLRLVFKAGALASAPTEGQFKCYVYATGPVRR